MKHSILRINIALFVMLFGLMASTFKRMMVLSWRVTSYWLPYLPPQLV